MARLLMVIAPERFRDEELFETRAVLEESGNEIAVASTRTGPCAGMLGGTASADVKLSDVNAKDYSAVVFVGGGGARLFFDDRAALDLAQEMHKAGKVVAAICLAPVILANAGILQGRKATVDATEAKTLAARGASYTGAGVTVDGNIVTGNGPKSSRAFGQQIQSLLGK